MSVKIYRVVDLIFSLFDDSKTFLNTAKINVTDPNLVGRYARASVIISWSAFEGWINKTCDDFADTSRSISTSEKGFLQEKRIEIKNGEFTLSNADKYETTENKIEFLLRKFADYKIEKSNIHWQNYRTSKELRDSIIHPKKNRNTVITIEKAQMNLDTLQYFIKLLSRKLYNKRLKF